MIDYMRALYRQFYVVSPEERTSDQEIKQLYRELSVILEKPDRKKLLQIVDLADSLHGYAGLNSFVAGFRVASGIYHELNMQPPYSFDVEEECRASRSERRRIPIAYENSEN